jgi:hypothetical protein
MTSAPLRAPRSDSPRIRLCRRVVVLGLLLLFGLTSPALAQTSTGNLRGYVTGANTTPVPGANVVARLLENGQTRNAVTNSDGFYYLGGLRPGRYDVSVRRIGFSPQTRLVDVGRAARDRHGQRRESDERDDIGGRRQYQQGADRQSAEL